MSYNKSKSAVSRMRGKRIREEYGPDGSPGEIRSGLVLDYLKRRKMRDPANHSVNRSAYAEVMWM